MKNFNTPTSAASRIRLLFLIALMAMLAACSSIRFTYNQGDTVLYW